LFHGTHLPFASVWLLGCGSGGTLPQTHPR
jgi:hypothetical protein